MVAGGMIVRAGRVLLGRRAPHRRIRPDTWDFIGGHGEPGESPAQTMARELYEEVGVTPAVFRQIAIIDFGPEAGEPVHYHLFRVDGFEGEPWLKDPEHVALNWFALTEAAALPDLASNRYRAILNAEAKEAAP